MATSPTEDFILNHTGKKSMSEIRTLSLRDMGLECVKPNVFRKLTNLTILDLSKNRLTEIPGNLDLKSLQKLDISDNKISSVEFVQQFVSLTELYIDNNSGLEASDKYIIADLCPWVQLVDRNKDESLQKVVENMRAKLQPEVLGVWEAVFSSKYSNGIPGNKVKEVKTEFLNHLKSTKPAGQAALAKLQDYMLTVMVEETIKSVQQGNFQLPSKRTRIGSPTKFPQSPVKPIPFTRFSSPTKVTGSPAKWGSPAKAIPVHKFSSPIKSISPAKFHSPIKAVPANKFVSPAKGVSSKVPESPQKTVTTRNDVKTPTKKRRRSSESESETSTPQKKRSKTNDPVLSPVSPRRSGRQNGTPGSEGRSRRVLRPNIDENFVYLTKITSPKKENTGRTSASSTPSKSKSSSNVTSIKTPTKTPVKTGSSTPSKSKSSSNVSSIKTPTKTPVKKITFFKNIDNALPVPDYNPLHFIRCHFGGSKTHADNDPTDNETQVWRAEFEPDPNNPGSVTGIVATCGGNCVCLIDCNTGNVMKRMKRMNESFYTLTWTTIEMKSGDRSWPTNILIVAGTEGNVRLVHPDQLICYHDFRTTTTKDRTTFVNCLLVHPKQKNILFCGDSKGQLSIWDIGIPSGPDYTTCCRCLANLSSSCGNILNMVYNIETDQIVVGGDESTFVWNIHPKDFKKEKSTDCDSA